MSIKSRSLGLFLGVPALVALACASGCSSTTNNVTTTGDSGVPGVDAGGDTSTPTDGSTSAGPFSFTPSNIGNALAGVDLSKLDDIDITLTNDQIPSDSTSCIHDTNCFVTQVVQSDGSTITVIAAKSWKIEANADIGVTGSHAVVLVALNTIEVLGHLDASAEREDAEAGGYSGGFAGTPGGPGVGTTSVTPTGGSGPGVGAGGGSYCGLGGSGGGGGNPGTVYGTAGITPLVGGSAGGISEVQNGGGGGAVQLVAGVSITVGPLGVISVDGGGGGYSGASPSSGGGTGGALLLESPDITISGMISANGGGGGGSGPGAPNGADGAPGATPAVGGNAARDPSGGGAAGGNGSGGSATAGTAGDPGNANYVAAAGGGGAGFIRLNSTSGEATITGTLSPALGSCATQAKLQ